MEGDLPSFDLKYSPSRHRSKRPGYDGTPLQSFFKAFPDDDACLEHVFRVRFGSDPLCPRCGGTSRWRRHHFQKHYFHPCGGILSPMAGVIFSNSHIPLQLWFYAMLHFVNSPESISSSFLARQFGVSEPTGYRVGQRIRLHMAALDEQSLLGAAHEPVIARLTKVLCITNPHKNTQNSALIFLLCDRSSVNSTIVIRPSQKNLRAIVRSKSHPLSRIITDCYWTYRALRNYSSGQPIAEYADVLP